jgi:hypothetical protein
MPFGDPASHVIFVNWLENSTSWKTAIDHWPFVFVKTQAKRPFRAVFSEPGKVDRSGASPLAFQETRIVIGFGRRLSSYRSVSCGFACPMTRSLISPAAGLNERIAELCCIPHCMRRRSDVWSRSVMKSIVETSADRSRPWRVLPLSSEEHADVAPEQTSSGNDTMPVMADYL